MTQRDLAEKIPITDKAVSKWGRGADFPGVSLPEPLAGAPGLSILDLVQGEHRQEAPTEVTVRSVITAPAGPGPTAPSPGPISICQTPAHAMIWKKPASTLQWSRASACRKGIFAKLHKFLGTWEMFPKTLIMHERQP